MNDEGIYDKVLHYDFMNPEINNFQKEFKKISSARVPVSKQQRRFYFHFMCNVVRAKPRCAELATWQFANLLRRRNSDERDY